MTSPAPLLSLEEYQELAAGAGLEQARLDGVLRDIRDYCGWHIAPAIDATVTADGTGTPVQQLPTLRLNSVASVTECGTLLAADAYEWSHDGSLRRRPRWAHWTSRYRGVVAVVNHGYTEVPANLISVILDATSTALAVPIGDAVADDTPETMGPFAFGGSTARVEFTDAQRRVLDLYALERRP